MSANDSEVKFRVPGEDLAAWKAAAAEEGLPLSAWIRQQSNAAPTLQDAQRAHAIVARAIEEGKLARQPCETCGAAAEAHHDDYFKPLKVRWLCRLHHRQWHKEHPTGIDWGLVSIRIDEERRTRWDTAAADAGETLSDYIRDAVDHRVEVGSLVVPADAEPETAKRQDSPAGRVQPGAVSRPTPASAGAKVFRGSDPKPVSTKRERK